MVKGGTWVVGTGSELAEVGTLEGRLIGSRVGELDACWVLMSFVILWRLSRRCVTVTER